MKAEVKYTYDEKDLIAIVSADHASKYPAPQDMKWMAKTESYPTRIVITAITAGQEKEEDEI